MQFICVYSGENKFSEVLMTSRDICMETLKPWRIQLLPQFCGGPSMWECALPLSLSCNCIQDAILSLFIYIPISLLTIAPLTMCFGHRQLWGEFRHVGASKALNVVAGCSEAQHG